MQKIVIDTRTDDYRDVLFPLEFDGQEYIIRDIQTKDLKAVAKLVDRLQKNEDAESGIDTLEQILNIVLVQANSVPDGVINVPIKKLKALGAAVISGLFNANSDDEDTGKKTE